MEQEWKVSDYTESFLWRIGYGWGKPNSESGGWDIGREIVKELENQNVKEKWKRKTRFLYKFYSSKQNNFET